MTTSAQTTYASPTLSGAELSYFAEEPSWGDKFREKVFDIGTYWGLNYFANAVLSSGIAYALEVYFGKQIKDTEYAFTENFVLKPIKWAFDDEAAESFRGTAEKGVKMGAGAFVLNFGGHIIAGIIKPISDRRYQLEMKIGEWLDSAQEKLGMGSETSKRNLEDYAAIRQMKNGEMLISDDTRMGYLQAKYNFTVGDDGKLAFNEHRKTVMDVVKSRIGAVIACTSVNIGPVAFLRDGFGKNALTGGDAQREPTDDPPPQYGKYPYGRFEAMAIPFIANIVKHTGIKKPHLAGYFAANDFILTVTSALTFEKMFKHGEKPPTADERIEAWQQRSTQPEIRL